MLFGRAGATSKKDSLLHKAGHFAQCANVRDSSAVGYVEHR